VQHRARKIAAHAFAERELPHGRPHESFQVENLAKVREILAETVARNIVDRA
jgi:hypothetical protein